MSDGGDRGYKVEFTGFQFLKPQLPGEVAFNTIVHKLLDEAPVDEKVDFDPPGGTLDFMQTMELTYASPALMSATVSTSRYDGGAHPNHYSGTYNKLSPQERRESMFDPTPQSMHEMVGNLSSWAFTEAGATILFPPYAIGPYAAGDFECDLPLKTLKGLALNKAYLPD